MIACSSYLFLPAGADARDEERPAPHDPRRHEVVGVGPLPPAALLALDTALEGSDVRLAEALPHDAATAPLHPPLLDELNLAVLISFSGGRGCLDKRRHWGRGGKRLELSRQLGQVPPYLVLVVARPHPEIMNTGLES